MGEKAYNPAGSWMDAAPILQECGRDYCLHLSRGGHIDSFMLDIDAMVSLMADFSKAYVIRLDRCRAANDISFQRH